jgi:type IV pilus assembly protein PilE
MPRKLQTGFTLVELIIVMAIISILASIAIPAYKDYVTVSKRSDAQASLMALAIAQEKYRATSASYATVIGDLNSYGVTANSESDYFTLAISSASSSGFEATASPKSPHSDSGCPSIDINQDGPTGALSCWGR